jgi:hypothetical protein
MIFQGKMMHNIKIKSKPKIKREEVLKCQEETELVLLDWDP